MIDFTIKGEIPSLKNVLRFTRNGRPYHQDDTVKDYKEAFDLLCPKSAKKLLTGPVEVILHIYKKDNRKDAVNLTAIIYDCLQSSGVIKNDRQIVRWYGFSEIDKSNPRVRIEVNEIKE